MTACLSKLLCCRINKVELLSPSFLQSFVLHDGYRKRQMYSYLNIQSSVKTLHLLNVSVWKKIWGNCVPLVQSLSQIQKKHINSYFSVFDGCKKPRPIHILQQILSSQKSWEDLRWYPISSDMTGQHCSLVNVASLCLCLLLILPLRCFIEGLMGEKAFSDPGSNTKLALGMQLENTGWVSHI